MVHSIEDIESRVVEAINREIGDKTENLENVEHLKHHYQIELESVESKLDSLATRNSSTIEKMAQSGETKMEEMEIFMKAMREKIDRNRGIIESVADGTEAVLQFEHLISYFKLVRDIQELSEQLKAAVGNTDETKMVELYLSLCGDSYSIDNVLGRTFETDAPNLKFFARRTALYWHDVLTEKFSKDFEKILKSLKWPSFEAWNPSKDTSTRLQQLAQLLFMIKLPGDKGLLNLKLTPYVICPPLTSPIEVLLKAYKERFNYHFAASRETNRLDKPEWYMTQILAWANEKDTFIAEHFQLPAIKAGIDDDMRVEFIRGLVQFAVQKLVDDIEQISDDDALFSHLVDEVLSFEQELEVLIGLKRPDNFPSLVTVITQPQYLSKWLSIEEIFASEKMDFILQSERAWDCLEPSNTEKLKIPRCADQFIRLLDAIRERYCNLPQPSHRILFLRLQMELIDNFQRRLVQLHNNPDNDVNTVHILNALNYVIFVLSEWGETVHYLHLLAAIHGPNFDVELKTVFDEIIKELEHWRTKLVQALSARLVDDIKAKSMAYRHDNWIAMPETDLKVDPMILSFTAGNMFQLLVTILTELEAELSENLFLQTLKIVARQLDQYFIDSMVMVTRFSPGGANQFHFDMSRNLFALFGLYVRNPVALFKCLNDACTLLTLPYGTAKLLHDTLLQGKQSETSFGALKELGIRFLEPLTALETLQRRIDLDN